MHRLSPPLLLCLALAACGADRQPGPAVASAGTSTSTSVGGATLQTSTMALADLNPAIAARYGLAPGNDGVLLLVTVRDAAGNGIDPGDLQLAATAGTLTEPPRPLPLRSIRTGDLSDYIGVFTTAAPASVQFRLTATRGGARADVATTAELHPR